MTAPAARACCALAATVAFAVGGVSAAEASSAPSPGAALSPPITYLQPPPHVLVPPLPLLLPPLPGLLLPPLALSVSSQGGLPVAGHDYQFYVSLINISRIFPAWGIRLLIRFSDGLTLAGPAPPGCLPLPGGVACGYAWLPPAHAIPLVLTVAVASRLAGGEVTVSALVRYDLGLWASAAVSRGVLGPPPTPPPPTPAPTPPPPRRPHPRPPAPKPPRAHPRPAAPAPSPRPHRKPRPRPRPTPITYRAMPERIARPTVGPPKPVLPIGVLLTVILVPCAAVAATRFGKRTR